MWLSDKQNQSALLHTARICLGNFLASCAVQAIGGMGIAIKNAPGSIAGSVVVTWSAFNCSCCI
jgi:hypothetical protein